MKPKLPDATQCRNRSNRLALAEHLVMFDEGILGGFYATIQARIKAHLKATEEAKKRKRPRGDVPGSAAVSFGDWGVQADDGDDEGAQIVPKKADV